MKLWKKEGRGRRKVLDTKLGVYGRTLRENLQATVRQSASAPRRVTPVLVLSYFVAVHIAEARRQKSGRNNARGAVDINILADVNNECIMTSCLQML